MLCKGNPFLCSQFKTSFVSFCRAAPSREIERGNKFTSGIFSDMNPTSQVIPHGGERWDSNMVLGTFERREIFQRNFIQRNENGDVKFILVSSLAAQPN